MRFELASADWARLRLSPDGTRVLGSWRDGETERSVLNGRGLPTVAWKRGSSPACRWDVELSRRAGVEREGEAVYVTVSDLTHETRFGPFEDVKLGSDCFSSPGARLMFVFTRGGASWVWIEGEELGPFPAVEAPRWHGRTPSFVVRSDAGRHLRVGERTLGPFEVVGFVRLAEDGTLAVGLQEGGADFVLHGERRYGPFQGRVDYELGAGGRLAIERSLESGVEVALGDGREVGRFTRVRSLRSCFSPDGRRLGFAYDHGEHSGFFLDGERRENLGYTDGPWWSPDGGHVAWGADTERGLLVVDGAEQELPLRLDWELGSSFRFAPSGEFCFMLAADGEQVLRIGPREFGPFELGESARQARDERVAFSADGAHFAFLYQDRGGTFVRHDARLHGPYGSRTTFTLSPAGTLYVATFDEGSLTVTLTESPA